MAYISVRDCYRHINDAVMNDSVMQSLGVSGVFSMKAPEAQPTPYVLTERPAGRHVYSLGESEMNQEHWIVIKAVDRGVDGGTRARAVNDRMNEILTGSTWNVTGGYSMRCAGISELEYVDAEAGNIQYFHIGTMFKFLMGTS